MARTPEQILAEIAGTVTGNLIVSQALAQAQLESLRESLAIVTGERDAARAERDALKAKETSPA